MFHEALRIDPPAQTMTASFLTKTEKVTDDLTLRAGDIFFIHFWGLHHNPEEWQRPDEFLPDRWDPTHPLYLTPKGTKRNPYSFSPFSGGKRVCFGKTFADYTARIVSSILFYSFEMQFADEKFKTETPKFVVLTNRDIQVHVKLTPRQN